MTQRNVNEAEKKIIEFWRENKIFEKSVERDAPNGEYIFYDGPPFATGTPHYGHIIGSVLKDVIPRYWTMKGYRVERKWGWDCHGLPIENLIEKDLELKSKKDIEAFGVDKFNKACRDQVLLYANEWKTVIERLGRFVDMENAYKTMDIDFMESIWWVFKNLWDKKLIYRDYKSMHICPRCETTLSQSEVAQGYETVKDISVVAKFELVDEAGVFVLAWTTTPWTLPGNVVLAVGEKVEYVKIKHEELFYILAKDRLSDVFAGKEYEFVSEISTSDLIGRRYKPLFDYFVGDTSIQNIENAYKIVAGDFVSTSDGTGVVHIAPAFGQDDMELGKNKNLPFIQHVGMDGRFLDKIVDWPSIEVKPKDDPTRTDVEVVKYLAGRGTLFSKAKYEHTYPHCWRCDSPLLNYATSSWFVDVTTLKPRMIELAEKINWMPNHIKDGRFGQWLSGVRDWSISRQRYWGSVLPIWECECGGFQVFGSIAELEQASGQKINDLHKDTVDLVTVPCSCRGVAKRIPDVLDCWFESGAMPYAQMHYPFENREKFEKNFPAKYIGEGVDQTRCWFYYLHVLSTAIMDNSAFENVIVNGIVLAEDGKKMSKRLKNYPDPMEVMEKYGSDAMRLYLMSSQAVQADDLSFSEKGVDEVFKKVIMIWWNIFSFYKMYEVSELVNSYKPIDSLNVLDRWALARLEMFVIDVTSALDSYDLMRASRYFADFVNDISTWYVRRSRERFKSNDLSERGFALATLRHILRKASIVMAPIIPFITEEIFKDLRDEVAQLSIHLADWPIFDKYDKEVISSMCLIREITESVLSVRATRGIKIRQVLSEAVVKGCEINHNLIAILSDEVNIRKITCLDVMPVGDNWICREVGNGVNVTVNIAIDDDLRKEGLSRELIRHLNLWRKQIGLTINDEISLIYKTDDANLRDAIVLYESEIRLSTKLKKLSFGESESGRFTSLMIGDSGIDIMIEQ